MFGFNSITIDPKGRIAMPAKYRDILFELNTNKIVVTQDPQYPALKIYIQTAYYVHRDRKLVLKHPL